MENMTSSNKSETIGKEDFFFSNQVENASRHTDSQLREYWTNGYIVLRNLFRPEEIQAWSNECDRLLGKEWVHAKNVRTPFNRNSGAYPERIDPVVDVSPLLNQLVKDERILEVVRKIFQSDPVLFKDKLIFKAPGAMGYTMHQDQAWWQLCAADDILSVSIQIDGANVDNGCIELVPGQHARMRTPVGVNTNFTSDPELMEEYKNYPSEKVETVPGDVLIFHSLAPHCSAQNTSDTFRRSLYLTYNSARAGDLYAEQLDQYVQRLKRNPEYEVFR